MKEDKIFENISQDDFGKITDMIRNGSNDVCTYDDLQNSENNAEENTLSKTADIRTKNSFADGQRNKSCNTSDDEQQNQTAEGCKANTAEKHKQTTESCEACGEEHSKKEINEHKLGKFKNPQELLRAYGELEKEFTRRSQRLKELESGKQPIKNEDEWRIVVDKFFKEIPAAKSFAKDIANEIINHPELKEDGNCLNVALVRVLADKFRTPEQLMQDGQFLNDYVLSSERVRDAIIADYLDGVRAGMPPYTMPSGGLQCVAPKVKPRTIEEAGSMFLKNNK